MKKIKFCLLWHQHQPFYKDTLNEIYKMPWVLMHAYKDYYDMLYLVRKNKFKATFNLVPVLLYQLEDYIQNPEKDELYVILAAEPTTVTEEKLRKLFTYAFDSMDHKKIHANSRYHSLLLRYREGEPFSPSDILDLQVLLQLAWFGEVTYRNDEKMAKLRRKKGGFTAEDKEYVLSVGRDLLAKTITAHREAFLNNEIEVTTTPFFHPILPLLDSFLAARVSVPDLPLPAAEANMAEDVEEHIRDGKQYAEERLGKKIRGFWPSEGSVSPAVIPAFARNGVEWIATDQGILANSFRLMQRPFSRRDIYYPYEFRTEAGAVKIFFRDTELSDLIGFTYSQWDLNNAVDDFISRLAAIRDLFQDSPDIPVVSVILDGENAWEHYPENGYPFLDTLYRRILNSDWIEVLSFSELLDSNHPVRPLERLFSGSWIYSNLNTWIGHREKNRAWELLVEAREVYRNKTGVSAAERQKARFELMAAEGSDWFWWYGDDFYSHFSDDFDALFRLHLRNVYQYLGEEPPAVLHKSIRSRHKGGLRRPVSSRLDVRITGDMSGYFDWLGAGEFDLTYDASTMHLATRRMKTLLFGPGYSEGCFGIYLCLIGNFGSPQQEKLELEILDGCQMKLVWDLDHRKLISAENLYYPKALKIAQAEALQFFIPLDVKETQLQVQFRLLREGNLLEKAPLYSAATLPIELQRTPDWVV